MTFSQGMDDFSRNAHQAADAVAHTAEQVLKVGMENSPLFKEVSLLQQAATVIGTMEPNPLRAGVQAIDDKLHQCGVLPHLHIGLDDHNNPTLRLDTQSMKTDCFGYMHVPGFGGGQAPVQGRQDVSHGHYEGSENVIRDAGVAVDNVITTVGDMAKKAGIPDGKGHPHLATAADNVLLDPKGAVDTVINTVSDLARQAGFPLDPRA